MTYIFNENGETIRWEKDSLTGEVTVKRTADVEPILVNNHRLQTLDKGYTSPAKEMRRIASIPFHVFENWLKADGLTWADYYHKMDRRERAKYRARKISGHGKLLTAPNLLRMRNI